MSAKEEIEAHLLPPEDVVKEYWERFDQDVKVEESRMKRQYPLYHNPLLIKQLAKDRVVARLRPIKERSEK